MEKSLRELDALLLRNHRHNTALFDELSERQLALGISHDGRPLCTFLRPYFLEESRYASIRRAAAVLSGAFESMAAAALADPFLAERLGLSEKELLWSRLDPGYRGISLNSRLDTFLNADGFSFLEYNGENPAGVGDQPALQELFGLVPEVRDFLSSNPHHHPQPQETLLAELDAAYREFGGKKEKPSIGIVDWKGVATAAEFEILQEVFASRGYPAAICHPEQLEYDGKNLRAGEFAIDIFYKRVIIHEFLERYDESHALYKACEDGAVCMANSFRSKIPHKKSSFAVLSDPGFAGLFTAEQREAIGRHIPWTRVVMDGTVDFHGREIDLIDLLRRERERFALKPNDDYGGHGIYLGWETSESAWDEAIDRALSAPYIAQERVEVEKTDIPQFIDGEARMSSLLVDFDPFLFRGVVDGGMVRLSGRSLVNVTQGGGETGLVILTGH